MEPEPSYGRDGYIISGEMINSGLSDVVDGLTPASEVPAKIRFSARGRLTEDDFFSQEVIWVPGFPPAESCKISPSTKRALRLTYQTRKPL